ncbi:hypothetical protein EIP86_009713 [Pleurotus ostreatoroseus]|nr:hypothetical protein EIP86_009713 [Pleurotus ostreatoroseus]
MVLYPLLLIGVLTLHALAQSAPDPLPVSGNISVHDPTSGVGIEARSSPDRVHWTYEGAVFPNGAPWTDGYAAGGSSTGNPGDWSNEGLVFSTTDNDNYNAIDPK